MPIATNHIKVSLWALGFFFLSQSLVYTQTHPSLALTPSGIRKMQTQLGSAPLFDQVLMNTQAEVDAEIEQGIEVPVPKDMAGGYTHERHKRNWFMLQKAGIIFQLTEEEKYAIYIRDMLLEYAKLYPNLPLHPTNRSYATGKIFWQCLNDANWLVYVSQAYDCIYNWLSAEERKLLEEDLFRPMADFLSIKNPQFFNRIHNHSTWANAAVGMIGLVMQDEELIDRALKGLSNDQIPDGLRDDDSGLIKEEGQTKAGFLAQLDYSFSPDGYFTEGPYYLRYAIYPFLVFSKALANNRPELNILEYRDRILRKAVYALLYQSDAKGHFFPINDAQKGMSWQAREVITAVDFVYQAYGQDPSLLVVADKQNKVSLDEAGFAVALALNQGLKEPFKAKSIIYTDGEAGDEGGLGILRSARPSGNETCLVFKYSAQGMGHGHFDKLSYSLYDEKGEVIQDYGAARWVNIDQKGGGRYLPENKTWAKQSIAHNTIVIDEESHFKGDIKLGELQHPELQYSETTDQKLQIINAIDKYAYPGQELDRTLILLNDDDFDQALLIDIFLVRAEGEHQFDLPLWYQGQLISSSFPYQTKNDIPILGKGHGYQHLWLEAEGKSEKGFAQIGWFNQGKFYTYTTLVVPSDELYFLRLGANDPHFNLRRDPGFLVRKKGKQGSLFLSILEAHGAYSPVDEIPIRPYGSITDLRLIYQDRDYLIFSFSNEMGRTWTITLALGDKAQEAQHNIKSYQWQGSYQVLNH